VHISQPSQTSSDEGSEAEVGEEEEESDDEFCDRTTAPVPKWGVLAGNRDRQPGEQGGPHLY
jgi:hypothetical protein